MLVTTFTTSLTVCLSFATQEAPPFLIPTEMYLTWYLIPLVNVFLNAQIVWNLSKFALITALQSDQTQVSHN